MDRARVWQDLLDHTAPTFTRPAFRLFARIASGWILCPARRTIIGIIPTADPQRTCAHDAFHRFFRDAVWRSWQLWRQIALQIVGLCPESVPLALLVDDTIVHKTGPEVEDAGVFRDPIRSTSRNIVYAFGLNVVLLCVRLRLPVIPQPLALAVDLRIYRKGGPSHVALAADMVRQLAGWLPLHRFLLIGDGAYASLAKQDLPRTHVVSRLRRDAALFDLPPPRQPGQPGRPRKKGARLPSLARIAAQATPTKWTPVHVRLRNRMVPRQLFTRTVLWYQVTGPLPIRLVTVRDPSGHEHDDYFFTTDINARPADVAADYGDRWAIEVTFRDAKQLLGVHQPQSWRRGGPERTVMVGFWLHSAVWLWFLHTWDHNRAWPDRPWYTRKCSPSFADALTELRAVLWHERLSPASAASPDIAKLIRSLVASLARAG